jgi:hypothetical protein
MPARCYGINMIKYIYMQKTNSSRDAAAIVKMSAGVIYEQIYHHMQCSCNRKCSE